MTHRQFSRNARSSRAVPVKRLLTEDPYIPHFLKNQPGMQGFEELDPGVLYAAQAKWLECMRECVYTAEDLATVYEVHKQWANRMLEWFGYIDVVVSSTYWKNFFNLRDHPAAMPEIQHLARTMRRALDASIPHPLWFGEWHLPYVLLDERMAAEDSRRREENMRLLRLLSTARCARVSYKPFDAETADPEKDISLAERLILEDPLHASPAEHQATPDRIRIFIPTYPKELIIWENFHEHGNFAGWRQHRKMYDNEAVNEDYSISNLLRYIRENHPHAEEARYTGPKGAETPQAAE